MEDSFRKLKAGIHAFIRETNFKRMVLILRSAGFVYRELIRGTNAINFSYVLYLKSKEEKIPEDEIEIMVRRWYVSILTIRYTGNPDSAFDFDIRQLKKEELKILLTQ